MTLQEAFMNAEQNLLNHYGDRVSPLIREILKAINEAPKSTRDYTGAGYVRKFAQRIATRHSVSTGAVAALRYANWTGEWLVTQSDLYCWGHYSMWAHRYDPGQLVSDYLDPISAALGNKRMQQAYDRYQKTGLRSEHCKLMGKLSWEMDTLRGDWVSLFVQGKRPLGDSSIDLSIYGAVGWDYPVHEMPDGSVNPEYDAQTRVADERAWDLFDEIPFAVPDMAKLANLNLKEQ